MTYFEPERADGHKGTVYRLKDDYLHETKRDGQRVHFWVFVGDDGMVYFNQPCPHEASYIPVEALYELCRAIATTDDSPCTITKENER